MSIAEKLQTIAENEQRVFDAGKQAERDGFWDVFQAGGKATTYFYAFSYGKWTDENYNPRYDIAIDESNNFGQNVFYNTGITDTKVAIIANGLNISGMFYRAKKLKTIRKLSIQASTGFATSTFTECEALETLIIEGVIQATSVNLSWSTKLNRQSIESVITHLSPTITTLSLTLSLDAVNKAFETAEGANDGSSSAEWIALRDSRTNWTISLS